MEICLRVFSFPPYPLSSTAIRDVPPIILRTSKIGFTNVSKYLDSTGTLGNSRVVGSTRCVAGFNSSWLVHRRVQIIRRGTRYKIRRDHDRLNLIRAIAVITIAIEVIRVNGGTAAGVTAVVTLLASRLSFRFGDFGK